MPVMSNENETTDPTAPAAEPAVGADKPEDKTKDFLDNVKEGTLEAASALGGLISKAGDAIVNAAEKASGKDLNKDGTIGGQKPAEETAATETPIDDIPASGTDAP
jgi:hypothetical protein